MIFGNIRRFVFFLLSCKTSEVLVVASAPLTSLLLPVLPLAVGRGVAWRRLRRAGSR